jgi:hypothetical protein
MIPLPRRKAMPVADRDRQGNLYEHEHPRLAAIRFLRERIADKRAGLDQYDRSIFILAAAPHEKVWGNRALELCGIVLTAVPQPGGRTRYRAVLEADVRIELGLDAADAPMMDEPLASRAVSAATAAQMFVEGDDTFDEETGAMRALKQAREAYERRFGIQVH